jgi:hypothetical protein
VALAFYVGVNQIPSRDQAAGRLLHSRYRNVQLR